MMEQSRYDELLFKAALRTRPDEVSRLAHMVHGEVPVVAAALNRLSIAGLLGFDGERIAYTSPAGATAALIMQKLEDQMRETRALLAVAESLTTPLVDTMRDAAGDRLTEESLALEVFEGAEARYEALSALVAQSGGGELIGSLPNPASVDARTLSAELRPGARARLIIPKPKSLGAWSPLTGVPSHIAFRGLVKPPFWFWVSPSSDQVALPLGWGDHRPTKIILLTSPSAAHLVATLFEFLWLRGQPYDDTHKEALWVPLLRLLRGGVSLDEAARSLGINPRTARRRLASGMDTYGVDTLFGLAAAWASDVVGGRIPDESFRG